MSINPCLDAMLVHLADRGQIAALSHFSRVRQQSNIYDLALELPSTRGTAEEIISLNPDLVLGRMLGDRATNNALSRLGITPIAFDVPSSVAESLSQVRNVAELVGYPERGETLVRRINTAITSASRSQGRRLKAIIYQPNGFAAGQGTMLSEMMERSGFVNMAGEYGIGKWGHIPLENILSNPPEVLLGSRSGHANRTWGERMLEHPALSALRQKIIQIPFEERLLYCGGPVLVHTAQVLAHAHRTAMEQI